MMPMVEMKPARRTRNPSRTSAIRAKIALMAERSGRSTGDEPQQDRSLDGEESVDSFLRDVARAPDKALEGQADGTIKSSTPGAAAPVSLRPGTIIAGRFRLERSLGEGGMGVVWQAVHAVTRKPVALKFLKASAEDEPRAVQRFLREARAACAVRHPSVVEVHDVLQLEDGSPVMVMELLTGETLARRLAREGAIPLPEVARILVHVCSAVGSAHAQGIVHRDLKPENIFLAKSQVKVLDFGIAKLTALDGDAAHTGATTGTGAILGTPYYMAPEQLFGEKDVDHRADIWALGIILYEALVGTRPTQAANMGQIYKLVTTGGIPSIAEKAPHLPGPVVNLVSRMLSRDRNHRPADVREVLSTLSAYTDESFVPVDAPPVRGPALSDPSAEIVAAEPGRSLGRDSDTVKASTVETTASTSLAHARRVRQRTAIAVVVAGAGVLGAASFIALRSENGAPAQKDSPPVAVQSAVVSNAPLAPTPAAVAAPPTADVSVREAPPASVVTTPPAPPALSRSPGSTTQRRAAASAIRNKPAAPASSAAPSARPHVLDPGSYQ
jgi:serine/threonine protein kinase